MAEVFIRARWSHTVRYTMLSHSRLTLFWHALSTAIKDHSVKSNRKHSRNWDRSEQLQGEIVQSSSVGSCMTYNYSYCRWPIHLWGNTESINYFRTARWVFSLGHHNPTPAETGPSHDARLRCPEPHSISQRGLTIIKHIPLHIQDDIYQLHISPCNHKTYSLCLFEMIFIFSHFPPFCYFFRYSSFPYILYLINGRGAADIITIAYVRSRLCNLR